MNERIPVEKINLKVKSWSLKTKAIIRGRISSLSQKGKGELVKSLRVKYRKHFGLVDRITFSFDRHGVFFHYGVGRGYTRSAGKVIRKVSSLSADTSPKVLRKPREWFNPILDARFDELSQVVGKYHADAALVEISTLK